MYFKGLRESRSKKKRKYLIIKANNKKQSPDAFASSRARARQDLFSGTGNRNQQTRELKGKNAYCSLLKQSFVAHIYRRKKKQKKLLKIISITQLTYFNRHSNNNFVTRAMIRKKENTLT